MNFLGESMYIPKQLNYNELHQLRLSAYEHVQDHNMRFGQAFVYAYSQEINSSIRFESLFYTESVDEAETLINSFIAE